MNLADGGRGIPFFQRFLPFRMARVQSKLTAHAMQTLKGVCDLSLSEWRIVLAIASSNVDKHSEIVDLTSLDKGLVSRNIRRLVRNGLLTSIRDAVDHRIHILALTDAGRAIYAETLPVMVDRQSRLMREITGDETNTVLLVLGKLESAVAAPACAVRDAAAEE